MIEQLELSFKPMFTPKEMLHKGIFGGIYFSRIVSHKDFPDDWFHGLDSSFYLSDKYLSKGWMHKDDPRGWFEWYCKYFIGRRHEDDERQIKRWMAFCGPRGRWRNIIYMKIHSVGCGIELSEDVSRRIQQSLLHWSYVVNEEDYQLWLISKKIKTS
jgi:hypothetical protein